MDMWQDKVTAAFTRALRAVRADYGNVPPTVERDAWTDYMAANDRARARHGDDHPGWDTEPEKEARLHLLRNLHNIATM